MERVQIRDGVNVDQCTRYAEAAMCGAVDYYARLIYTIRDERCKVRIFRNKSETQVAQILARLSEEIRKAIIAKYYADRPGTRIEDIQLTQSSRNNRQDADLCHFLRGRPIAIEVKFGAETNRNIGMRVFEQIFGTAVFTEATSRLARRNWEDFFVAEGRDAAAQYQLLWQTLNGAIDAFNAFNASRGFVLPAANQRYMEKVVLNTTGDGKFDGEFMKFVLDGDNFSDLKRIPTGIGRWTIYRTERIDGRTVSRCNVIVRNYETNVQIKYVLNWKNNYSLRGNKQDKVPAKLGLGTPSWNVWVEVEVSALRAA